MRFSVSLLLFFSSIRLFAQQPASSPVQRALQQTDIEQRGELLTLPVALQTALERNYQIRITRTQEQIARNDYVPGTVGVFPTITGNWNSNNTLQDIRQTFLQDLRPPLALNDVNNRTNVIGVNMNWLVFDGLAMFDTYKRLGEVVRLSEVNTRANMEATLADVATGYYDVIRQVQRLIALRQALDISGDRLELAKANYEVGTRSKVDYLTAQVDYNADSAALIAQEQSLRNAKILLNTLLVRDPATEFAVQDTILVRTDLALEPLRESLGTNNPQLVAATLNQRIANLDVRLARSRLLPTINLTTGYNATLINNEGGFGVRTGRNIGLTYGLQAAIPIFTGFNNRRLVANARANALVAEYQVADQRLLLDQAMVQTFTQYQNSLTLLNLEVQNYRIALENVDIAYERYRVGNSTAVEFRDVQRNAFAAQARLIDAEFTAKAAEIELLRLSSTITQELKP